jgi:hypothetical protein
MNSLSASKSAPLRKLSSFALSTDTSTSLLLEYRFDHDLNYAYIPHK